jgi:O-acetylhomoserine/O-acetylserine sulfhydrylase-like pyridoxal-dependent enzyme
MSTVYLLTGVDAVGWATQSHGGAMAEDILKLEPEIEDGLAITPPKSAATTKPKFDTIAVHGGYDHAAMAANQGSLIEPLYLTSAQHFPDSRSLAAVLAYEEEGWGYSRIANPTVGELESRLALLETYGSDLAASACTTASGMAAVFLATTPLVAGKGPMNIVVSAHCYGGTFMLFS